MLFEGRGSSWIARRMSSWGKSLVAEAIRSGDGEKPGYQIVYSAVDVLVERVEHPPYGSEVRAGIAFRYRNVPSGRTTPA